MLEIILVQSFCHLKIKITHFPNGSVLTLTSHLGPNVGLGRGRWTAFQKRFLRVL